MDFPDGDPRRRRSFTSRPERMSVTRRSFCDLDLLSPSSGGHHHRPRLSSSTSFEQDLAVLQEEMAQLGSSSTSGGGNTNRSKSQDHHRRNNSAVIYDTPVLDVTQLPRGGISIQTQAVGAVQFGIPPETIKDSMRLGLEVPRVFIVPVERFCREIGPALGINLAEFE